MNLDSRIVKEQDGTWTLIITWPTVTRRWGDFNHWTEADTMLERIESGKNYDLVTGERIAKNEVK